MTVSIPTSVLILLVLTAVGVVLLLILLQVRHTRQEIEAHRSLVLGTDRGSSQADETPEVKAQSLWQAKLATHLRGFFAVGMAHDWGMSAGLVALAIAAAIGGGICWSVLRVGLHLPLAVCIPVVGVGIYLAPRIWLGHEQGSAEQGFLAVFPDTIDMAIRMLRAGLPIAAAIRSIGNEAAPPFNRVFSRMADRMAIGITFEDTLATAAEEIGLADFRFFAIAVALQRSTGGNITTTLESLSDVMRKRRSMRQKANSATGEVRMSAYVLGAMPFLVIGALFLVSPDYLQPLIDDPRGNLIGVIAIGSLTVGFLTMRQMLRSVSGV